MRTQGATGIRGLCRLLTALAVLSVLVAAGARNADAADKVRWSQLTASPAYWPIYVGEKKGFFAKQNIEIDSTFIASGAGGAVAALASDSMDLGAIATDGIVGAVNGGAKVTAVAAMYQIISDLQIVAAPEIKTAKDLKGKTCGATNPGKTSEAYYLRAFVEEKGGLKYPDDFSIIVAGPYASRAGALMAGQVKCVNVIEPFVGNLQEKGFVVLGDSAEGIKSNFNFLAVVASQKFATEKKDVLVRFLRALQAADAWLQDRANEAEAIEILAAAGAQFKGPAGKRTYDAFIVNSRRTVKLTSHDVLEALKIQYRTGLSPALSTDWQKYADLSFQAAAEKP